MKKLIVGTSSLKNAMKTANKVISKKSVLPIIEYFKCQVTIRNGIATLTVTATDLENYINISVNCEAKEEFTFLLHSDELKLIEKLDEQPLTIQVDERTLIAQLITETETVSVTCDDFNDFPLVPNSEIKHLGCFTNDFMDEIKTSLNYVSKDDLRPALTGINFKIENGHLELCSTDAHLLRTTTVAGELKAEAEGESFIMNPKFCKLISNLKTEGEIQISVMKKDSTSFITLSYSEGKYMNVELIGRNIEARYCDYKSVIPSSHATSVTLDKSDLLKRIAKAMIYANQTTYQGVFSINGNVVLKSSDVDSGKEYKSEFNHDSKKGEDIDIAFDLSLLKKVLNSLNGDLVTIWINNPNRAAVIKEKNSLTLIMPCLK